MYGDPEAGNGWVPACTATAVGSMGADVLCKEVVDAGAADVGSTSPCDGAFCVDGIVVVPLGATYAWCDTGSASRA